MAFTAKYPGRCDDCREAIRPGQTVEYKGLERVLVHVICDEAGPSLSDLDRDAERPVCDVCWLVQPCGCEVPDAS
ncbi:hypothetical protein [Agromyces sp. SYSU T00194]|uniref:hypothetical protein n=1 Tax=Agromyces chitinivorans TaxID=3158560 RepID=UPI00339106FC